MSVSLDLARDLLDHQLVDSEDKPCGKVDDIELTYDGRKLRIAALLCGPGAVSRRLPRWGGAVWRWLAGAQVIRVPWSEVESVAAVVHLSKPARELGLERLENPARRVMGAG
jgi:hypothetical protein